MRGGDNRISTSGRHRRLRELWRQHRWYQRHLGWIIESEMENRAELRFVLRMLRKARRDAMRVPDPITEAKGWNE